jgi:hypothetical protein
MCQVGEANRHYQAYRFSSSLLATNLRTVLGVIQKQYVRLPAVKNVLLCVTGVGRR